jgi:hypothetical protein
MLDMSSRAKPTGSGGLPGWVDDELRKACWRCYANSNDESAWADVRRLVATDPKRAWRLLRDWIDTTERPDDGDLYAAGMLALTEQSTEWANRVTGTAKRSQKVSSVLAESLSGNPARLLSLVGRDRLAEVWVRYQREGSDWDFWAADFMMAADGQLSTDEFWSLVIDLAAASAQDEEALSMVGVGPIEDLLHTDWEAAIVHIERDAPGNEPLRRALSCVWRLIDVPPEIIERVHRAAAMLPKPPML